jgi:hypothetical protein
MNKSQLSRRHFNTLCAVGLSLPGGGIASVLAEDAPPRTVKLPNLSYGRMPDKDMRLLPC